VQGENLSGSLSQASFCAISLDSPTNLARGGKSDANGKVWRGGFRVCGRPRQGLNHDGTLGARTTFSSREKLGPLGQAL